MQSWLALAALRPQTKKEQTGQTLHFPQSPQLAVAVAVRTAQVSLAVQVVVQLALAL
jgi:hypothetical protein